MARRFVLLPFLAILAAPTVASFAATSAVASSQRSSVSADAASGRQRRPTSFRRTRTVSPSSSALPPSSSLRQPLLHLVPEDADVETPPGSYGGSSATNSTPLDRPLLAIIDAISLILFAAIGKSSHVGEDGSLDIVAVLVTAFPFATAWLATSPVTGVYGPDDRENGLVASTAAKVGKGWIVAIPLGIALRGAMKGYVPPVPFVIVALISTLAILTGARILFSVAEDFFVELVN